ncbi:MAG: DEAD/DEAH box helicase [Lentisphaerae bacterium]|nr:DEAD/DEAH box helicase [Lentisphaerota bacterium]
MPSKPTVDHPETAPSWLAHWPAESEVRAQFPEGIRRLAYRFLGIERRKRLSWDESRLVFELGTHQATWRWDGQRWRRSCSCGYVNDACAHVYAAACMLSEVCRSRRWSPSAAPPAAVTAAGSVGAVAGGPAPAAPDAERPGGAAADDELELPRMPAVTAAPAAGVGARPGLEVEVDFHHEPGVVALRFYRRRDDRRELLRLQSLHNLATQARAARPGAVWSYGDWSLLKWLGPQLQRRPERHANLQVLKLTPGEFEHWQERWEDTPGRFVERASQQALGRRGLEPARLAIELRPEDDWVRIAAVVVEPSGDRRPFHELYQQLGQAGEEALASAGLLRFRPVLSWALLQRVFARRDPRLRREHVCGHLADLLEGHLEVVEGPGVRRERVRRRRLEVEAIPDGSDVLIRLTVGGVAVGLASLPAPVIRDDGRQFVIEVLDPVGLEAVRTALQALEAAPAANGRLRVQGLPARMEALRQAWSAWPSEVERHVHPALRALLGDTGDLQARLMVREEGRAVDLAVRWECQGVSLGDAELREALRLGRTVLRSRGGEWLAIDPERARALSAQLEAQGLGGAESLRLLRHDAKGLLRALASPSAPLAWSPSCQHLGERLLAEPEPVPLALPGHLAGILRPYQVAGFEFLADRSLHGAGAILADDMGLGKTLQVLALLEAWVQRRAGSGGRFRALVVCPASVVGVWLQEAERFCPGLRCRAAVGPAAARAAALAGDDWEVMVTHYALLRLDADGFCGRDWDMVVLDEAQSIKNPDAQVTRVAKALRTTHTLALTGTPIENRLLDLWSIMDFLNPGFLGSADDFTARWDSPARRAPLAARLAPLLLRRTKDAVAPELPARTEEVLRIEMTPGQRQVYDRELLRARALLQSRGPIEMLAALTRLRQVCCDPALLPGVLPDDASSAKLEAMVEMLAELAEAGHSALVFSQFTTMLERIQPALDAAGLAHLTLTGETPAGRRVELVREFQEAERPTVFLLSLRAAGTGLTLTRADYVFLFDPWWNPAVERQAIDRTHRIGQDKPVVAYRLVAADSVEDKVLTLQREKAELFAAVMGDAEQRGVAERLTREDLQRLLS